MAGRPTKLTPEIAEIILESISKGHVFTFAAEAAGVHRLTLRTWIKRGERGDPEYAAFATAIKRARAVAVNEITDLIRAAAGMSWQAAAWLNERTEPEEFGANRNEVKQLRREMQELKNALGIRTEKRGTATSQASG